MTTVRTARRLSPRTSAALLGAGRTGLAALLLAEPVAGVRMLGMDSASAKRVAHLGRMLAARDAAIGAGMLSGAARGRGCRQWLLAGAVADTGDAVALGLALRSGGLRGPRVLMVSAGAGLLALVAVAAAAGTR